MLSSILPGLRQLRAPFVAGALVLASLLLLLGDSLDFISNSVVPSSKLGVLTKLIGRPGELAVLGVAAYLIGTLVLSVIEVVGNGLNRRLNTEGLSDPEAHRGRVARFLAPFSRSSLKRLDERCGNDRQLARAVQQEVLRSGGKRLLTANKDLYLEYDRVKAEVELRRAVAFPGLLMVVALATNLDWPASATALGFLTAAAVLMGLIVQGRLLNKSANSMYAHSVADRLISTPSLDQPDPTQNDQQRFEAILNALPLHIGLIPWLQAEIGGFDSLKWSQNMVRVLGSFTFAWQVENFDDNELEGRRCELVGACARLYTWCGVQGGPFTQVDDDLLVNLKAAQHRTGGQPEFDAEVALGFELADAIVEARRNFESTGRKRGLRAPWRSPEA